ncbi:MAG: hypothetical protein K2Y37_10740 [Pirellulales bacterium]|nr:hypothetical protein [Pirellulales bacterium]
MRLDLATAIFWIGCGQLCVLVASALVPVRLDWRRELAGLPKLVRQLFWIYGGYVVLSIVSLGLICIVNAEALASGSLLARSFCMYGAAFWGIRLVLQPFLASRPFLTIWWLHAGYHVLTALFASFLLVYLWGAMRGLPEVSAPRALTHCRTKWLTSHGLRLPRPCAVLYDGSRGPKGSARRVRPTQAPPPCVGRRLASFGPSPGTWPCYESAT